MLIAVCMKQTLDLPLQHPFPGALSSVGIPDSLRGVNKFFIVLSPDALVCYHIIT